MRAWVYKVNSKRPGQFSGWHFDQYFRSRGRQPYHMGGREWIRSPMSWARLRRVRRGDLFVCYQADERKIYGLARAASAGYESLPGLSRAKPRGSGVFDSVYFAPRPLRLANPVDVRDPRTRTLFRHIRAFTVPSRGTIHALAADELRVLLAQLVAFNPTQRRALLAFARPHHSRRPTQS